MRLISEKKFYRNVNLYPTYEEARNAAHGKFINSGDYQLRYHDVDPRLPSNPFKTYNLKGNWADFLGIEPSTVARRSVIYPTYEEAKRAAHGKFTSYKDYQLRHYEVDPRLPSLPFTFYGLKANWADFLGTKPSSVARGSVIYPTYEEARDAAYGKFTGFKDYYSRYYEVDPRLPSNPFVFYGLKANWFDFLGTKPKTKGRGTVIYPTYRKAKKAAYGKFTGYEDYRLRHKDVDHRLPNDPFIFYNMKSIAWNDFLGTNGGDPSEPEILIKNFLDERGLRMNVDYFYNRFKIEGWSGAWDFYIKPNILIDIHGDYYHKDKTISDNKKLLLTKEQFPNYNINVLWEHEFYNPDMLRRKLDNIFNINVKGKIEVAEATLKDLKNFKLLYLYINITNPKVFVAINSNKIIGYVILISNKDGLEIKIMYGSDICKIKLIKYIMNTYHRLFASIKINTYIGVFNDDSYLLEQLGFKLDEEVEREFYVSEQSGAIVDNKKFIRLGKFKPINVIERKYVWQKS